MSNFIKPTKSVGALDAYENSRYTPVVFNAENVLKLDSNETHIPPSPRVIKALVDFIEKRPINWYPDVDSSRLREKLSEYTHFPAEFIQTFNGSDNALECIARTYIEKDDEIVICAPTYDHFRVYVQSCGGNTVNVYGPTPFTAKPRALVDTVTEKTKMIYIANPNNPTGTLYNNDEIEFILKNADKAVLVVDEAYYEFCNLSMSSFVDKYHNVIITRSFSKAFGLAGIRCGYIITQPDNITHINKVRIGKNINTLAQVAAVAALEDVSYMGQYVEEVKRAKLWLTKKLKSINLDTIDTPANYILIKVARPKEVADWLEGKRVYIRDRSNFSQLEGFLRITIATKPLMERFWEVFKNTPNQFLCNS